MKNKNKKQILFGLVVLSCLATVLGQAEKELSYLPVAPQERDQGFAALPSRWPFVDAGGHRGIFQPGSPNQVECGRKRRSADVFVRVITPPDLIE